MKKTIATLIGLITSVICLHAFRIIQGSTITGRVNPPGEIEAIWAFNNVDTIKSIPSQGAFALTAKPGIWKVVIDAKPPFKDAIIENVEVKANQTTDLGEIRLQQ
jgi:hypothetical protein